MYFHAKAVKRNNPLQPVHQKLKELVNAGFTFVPVKVYESIKESDALAEERRRIHQYGLSNLFNSVAGGGRAWSKTPEARALLSRLATGRKLSRETRSRISAALKGLVRSPETRKRMSKSMRRSTLYTIPVDRWRLLRNEEIAKTHSVTLGAVRTFRSKYSLPQSPKGKTPEQKKRMSVAMRGRKFSDQAKANMSASRRKGANNSRAVFGWLINPVGQMVRVEGINQFCKVNGLSRAHVGSVLLGKRRSHKGWTLSLSVL